MNPRRRRRLQQTRRQRHLRARCDAAFKAKMHMIWLYGGGFLGMFIDLSLSQTGPIVQPTDEEFARYAGPQNEGTP